MPRLLLKIQSKYAYAHAADPVSSLRYSHSATKLSRRLSVASTRCRSLGVDPRGPKGTPGCPRVPKGAFGALGGDGPTGHRSHSEWNPVSTGRYLRREGHSFRKKAVRMERPFRMDGSSEWKAVPCVHTAAETPNRMSADLVGF